MVSFYESITLCGKNRLYLKEIFSPDTICQNKRLSGATIQGKAQRKVQKFKEMESAMTETIYETKTTETGRRQQLPNNRRQIGQPGQAETEVFIEDYAFSFAKGLSERDYTGCTVGILVGEYVEGRQGDKILVRGVLETRDVLRHDAVCFTEDNWTQIYRDIREYFPKEQIVGWFLGGPGFLLEDVERQKKIQEDNFGGGDKILLKMDSIEKEQKIFFYQAGNLQELPGYYIYYEKNAEMQNYMAETGKEILKEREVPTAREFSMLPAQRPETVVPIIRKSLFYRLFYVTGGILTCLSLLVIAGLAVQLQEKKQLEKMLNQQEKLVSSLQQVYIVEEGETVETICRKFYGSTEQEAAIRLLNSLEPEEEPVAGQKIFLP